MMKRPDRRRVAVIGAGPSGLVTVKELLQEGHEVVCFERWEGPGGVFRYQGDSDVVGVWRTCRLTSSVLVTSFSDYLPPAADGRPGVLQHRQLPHAEYLRYLVAYAEHFDVHSHIRFDSEVVAVRPEPGGGWQVVVRHGGRTEPAVHRVDAVAVCSGLHTVPHVPQIDGMSRFSGKILHSAHYRGPESIAGRSAVFVGAGESGGDIVAEAAASLDRCYLSLRRGVFVIPRLLNGLPNDYTGTRLLYSLPDFVSRRTDDDARRLKRTLTLALLPLAGARIALDRLFAVVSRLRRRRTTPTGVRQRTVDELVMQMRASSRGNQFETFATKTDAFLGSVVDGRCTLRGPVRELTPAGVVFADGTAADVDAVVLCTGFESATVPFLEVPVDLTCLYKGCFDPRYRESLAFIGFVRPPIGAIPPLAEMQARWFAQLCSGAVRLVSSPSMSIVAGSEREHRRAYHHPVFERLPHLVDFSTYLDDLAEIIGCKPRFPELIMRPCLLYKIYTTAFSGVQYRLRGPHAVPTHAERVLLNAPSHVRPVRFLDLAVAELARLYLHRRFHPSLTLAGEQRRPDRAGHRLTAVDRAACRSLRSQVLWVLRDAS